MLIITLNRKTGEITREFTDEPFEIDYGPLVKCLTEKFIKEEIA